MCQTPLLLQTKRVSTPPTRLGYSTLGGSRDSNEHDSQFRGRPVSVEPLVVAPKRPTYPSTNAPSTFIERERQKYKGLRPSVSDSIDSERGQQDLDLDILPTAEEIYVPDSEQNRPQEISPLFKNVKRLRYRFPKQRDIDPLVKIIKDRAISIHTREGKISQR